MTDHTEKAVSPVDEWALETFAGRVIVRFQGREAAHRHLGQGVAWEVSVDDEADPAGDLFPAVFADFLGLAAVTPVDTLVVGGWGRPGHAPVPVELLCQAAPQLPDLKALHLGWSNVEYHENCADVGRLLAAYPRLEVLGLRGIPDPEAWQEPLRHTSLRDLQIQAAGLDARVARSLAASDLPALERLELWLGVRKYGGTTTPDDLEPILAGQRFPNLRHLGLCAAEHADEVAAAVAVAPVVAQLTTLDLSQGTLSDAGAEALLSGRPLTHLRTLDLHHHFLSDTVQERLEALLPGIVDLTEHEIESWEDEAFIDGRYTVMRSVELAFAPVDE